jgi:hypothetical protein
MFRAPTLPLNRKCILNVLRVTQSKVERHEQELKGSVDVDYFTPIDAAIYADCPGGMCKWDGEKFELVPKEEESRLGGYQTLSKHEFTGVNGWSERWIRGTTVGEAPAAVKFSVEVNPRTTLLVNGTNPVHIDLQRADGTSQRIWYHEQRTRLVSGATYKRVFASD